MSQSPFIFYLLQTLQFFPVMEEGKKVTRQKQYHVVTTFNKFSFSTYMKHIVWPPRNNNRGIGSSIQHCSIRVEGAGGLNSLTCIKCLNSDWSLRFPHPETTMEELNLFRTVPDVPGRLATMEVVKLSSLV